MDSATFTKNSTDTQGIHMDPSTSYPKNSHGPLDLHTLRIMDPSKHRKQNARIPRGKVQSRRLADLTPSIFRGTFFSCKTHFVRVPSKTASWSCENEAFVQDFTSKTATSACETKLSCEPSLLWDFFGMRFLWCEISLLWNFFAVRFLWYEISLVWDFFGVRFLCCETSLLRDFFAVRFLWYEICLLWGFFAAILLCSYSVTRKYALLNVLS